MHYPTLVVLERGSKDVPDLDAAEEAVEEVLKPYKHQYWDWWQVGGRWTGTLDGYEPGKDQANVEQCDICFGTGRRDDPVGQESRKVDPKYTCNGCDGKGERVKWPTQWKRHGGDLIPVSKLTTAYLKKFFNIAVEGWGFFASERFEPWRPTGKSFVKQALPPVDWIKKEFKGCVAVVVDCHN